MSALAHLGASPKQKPTLPRHQNAMAATPVGDPYPASSGIVSFFWGGFEDNMHWLTYAVTNFRGTERRQTPETQGRYIGQFIREVSHLVKFGRTPLTLPVPLELNTSLRIW